MAPRTGSLDGQVVLVTGAARGIGADSARRLAERGARVSLVGLEPERLEQVAADCGPGAVFFEADITDVAALERAVEGTVASLGGIDTVVANAGIADRGTLRAIDPAAFERTIEVNLLGTWRTLRACLPAVIERRGYVLVVASLAAAVPVPMLGSYGASKAAIELLAKTLRLELSHLGVDVGVAYFSFVDTDLVAAANASPSVAFTRTVLPAPLRRTRPASIAVAAVVRAVEHRSRAAYAPRWVSGMVARRELVGRLSTRRWRAHMAQLEAIEAEERSV